MFLFFVTLISHQYTTYCQWAASPPRILDVPFASSVSSPKDEGAAWAQEKLQKSESDWQIMVTQTAGKEMPAVDELFFFLFLLGQVVGGWYWQRTLGNEHFRKTGALLTFILQHSPLKCHSITSLKQLNVAVVKKNQWIQTNDAGALKCIHVSQTLRLAMDQRTDLCMWLNAEVTHFPCGHKTKYYKEMHLKLGLSYQRGALNIFSESDVETLCCHLKSPVPLPEDLFQGIFPLSAQEIWFGSLSDWTCPLSTDVLVSCVSTWRWWG